MEKNKNLLTRRWMLRRSATAGAGLLAAPMFNRGRYRIFAALPNEYSARAIDLVKQATVVDMLCVLTLDFAKQAMMASRKFTAASIQPVQGFGHQHHPPAVDWRGRMLTRDFEILRL